MHRDELSPLMQDVLYAHQHRLLDDPIGRAAKRAIDFDVADQFITGLLRRRVHSHKVAHAFAGPLLTPRLCGGDLLLGFDSDGQEIRHPRRYLVGHTLVIAGSGSGKTMRARFLVLQLAITMIGLWLFDFRKREFRVLRQPLERIGVRLLVIPGRRLRLNPLQVPAHVAPSAWASRVADLLVLSLRLPSRAAKLVSAGLFGLYRKFAITEAPDSRDKTLYPTLFDLREAIAHTRDANHQARQAILDSLDPVLMSIGSVLSYRRGWSPAALAGQQVVFEFGDLPETDKDLLLNTLVLSEFTSRVALGVSNKEMDLLIVCDEAARLISNGQQGAGVADLIGLVRGTGAGLDLSVQSSDVIPAVLSNTANKWIGRCGSAADYDLIGSAMGLTGDQRRHIALNLKPGTFVAQVGEGDWRHPFIVRLPAMQFPAETMTLAHEVDDSDELQALLRVETVAAEGFKDWRPGNPVTVAAQAHEDVAHEPRGVSSPTADLTSGHAEKLTEAEIRFLRAVIEHPGQPSSALPRLAGISARKALVLRQRLIDLGFLRVHAVNTGPRGRRAIVLEPLDRARQAVQAAAGRSSS